MHIWCKRVSATRFLFPIIFVSLEIFRHLCKMKNWWHKILSIRDCYFDIFFDSRRALVLLLEYQICCKKQHSQKGNRIKPLTLQFYSLQCPYAQQSKAGCVIQIQAIKAGYISPESYYIIKVDNILKYNVFYWYYSSKSD